MSEWISVEDRKPEGDCLVFLDKESLGRRIHSAKYCNIVLIGHHFHWDCTKVTHWMPLPAAPKE